MVRYEDVIDVDSKNLLELKVSYGGVAVTQGKEFTPTQTRSQPNLTFQSQSNDYYTLAMVDPDAPSRASPKFREWRHFLVTNIRGNNVSGGDTITPYAGPSPPKGTGLHRYVFVLFKQPSAIKAEALDNEGRGRASFQLAEWTKKYSLTPLAVTHFQAQCES